MAAYAAVRRRTITEQNETELLTSVTIRPGKDVPKDSADDGARGLFLSAHCFIPFQPPWRN
jgi:hypothetical protein